MNDPALIQAHAALPGVPALAALDASKVQIQRLGGLTNLVFRVADNSQEFCLRIPGAGTQEYINRVHEARSAREAAAAGVSPELIYFNESTGLMVTKYLSDAETMSAQGFRDRRGSPARAGEAFRKLHDSAAQFSFRFELFAMVDEYLGILEGKEMNLPQGYHEVLEESKSVREALSANRTPITACHCDPLCENFLDTGQRMWIVDWEYSGMNDPMWDLGDLSVEAGFDAQQDTEMITAYFAGEPKPYDLGRIVIYKAMCDLLWTLWGLIQHANQNPAEDFWAYAVGRFERCKALMAHCEFDRHLRAVRTARI